MPAPDGPPHPVRGDRVSLPVRLDEDYHVHSTFSGDAVSTLAQNVAAARERGLRTVCLAEHVRRETAAVPGFLAAVRALPPVPGLRVLAGVEAKILDTRGRLDLPDLPPGVDLVLIADHQFPGRDGPLPPSQVGAALAGGVMTAATAVEALVEATVAALRQAGADRPPVQRAAEGGARRVRCSRPPARPAGQRRPPGRRAGGGEREMGLPVGADAGVVRGGRGAAGREHRQP